MSALTEKVAREHQRIFNARRGLGPHCTCGWVRPGYDGSREHAQHIAEVTEQAVRAAFESIDTGELARAIGAADRVYLNDPALWVEEETRYLARAVVAHLTKGDESDE